MRMTPQQIADLPEWSVVRAKRGTYEWVLVHEQLTVEGGPMWVPTGVETFTLTDYELANECDVEVLR